MLKFVRLFPLPPEGCQEAAPQGSGSFALPGDLLVYSWWLVPPETWRGPRRWGGGRKGWAFMGSFTSPVKGRAGAWWG